RSNSARGSSPSGGPPAGTKSSGGIGCPPRPDFCGRLFSRPGLPLLYPARRFAERAGRNKPITSSGLEVTVLRNFWNRLLPLAGSGRRAARKTWRARCLLSVEQLNERITPAVTAFFSPGGGVLSVFGDALDNTITISRDAAGKILVNNGAVTVLGGTPTVANT